MVRSFINLSTGRMEFIGDEAIKQSYSDASVLFWNNSTKRVEEDVVTSVQYFVYTKATHSLGLGGTPASDTRFHVKGTTSSHGGRFDVGVDFSLVSPPSGPPTLALINSTGNINVGTHYYRITYKTALGETELNIGNLAYIVTDAANAQVTVTLPVSTDYRVTHVCIYRAVTGGTYWADVKKVGQVTNGTTTFIDNISDANRTGLDSFARGNTTNRFITVNGSAGIYVGAQNTFFGYRAGESTLNGTTSGGENTIIGPSSGITLNGTKNVAIGPFIGVVSSDSSVFIGHNAGGVGGYFQGCIVIGRNAAFYNTTSYASIFIGGAKGTAYWTGSYITSVGAEALSNIATGAGNLVVLGTLAAANLTTAVGCFIAGAFVNAPSATAAGQMNILNIIYGLGGYGTSVSSAIPTATAQIGIGIVPTGIARLQVAAGTAVFASMNLTQGVIKTTSVNGDVEFNGTSLFFTNVSGVRQNIMMSAYGQLYEDTETGSTITTTVANTPYGWVTAAANGYLLMTPDVANATADRLTVDTGGDGVYLIEFSVSYTTTNNNINTHWQLYKNGVAVANCNTERKFINGGYLSPVSSSGIVTLAAGDYIDLRVTSDNAGEVITVKHVSLVATRIKR